MTAGFLIRLGFTFAKPVDSLQVEKAIASWGQTTTHEWIEPESTHQNTAVTLPTFIQISRVFPASCEHAHYKNCPFSKHVWGEKSSHSLWAIFFCKSNYHCTQETRTWREQAHKVRSWGKRFYFFPFSQWTLTSKQATAYSNCVSASMKGLKQYDCQHEFNSLYNCMKQ